MKKSIVETTEEFGDAYHVGVRAGVANEVGGAQAANCVGDQHEFAGLSDLLRRSIRVNPASH